MSSITIDVVSDQQNADLDYQSMTEAAANVINKRQRGDVHNAMFIGQTLLTVKQARENNFWHWVSTQRLRFRVTGGKEGFRMSNGTCANYMHLYGRFKEDRFTNFVSVGLSRLYELAAPNFPESEIQAAIDAYIFTDNDLPVAMQVAVDEGQIGLKQARAVVNAFAKTDPAIKNILNAQVITDPAIATVLEVIGTKSPELLLEIVKTGAVQSGEDSISLAQANVRDITAALGEHRFNKQMQLWQESRTVLLQHHEVQPIAQQITVKLPDDKPVEPGGKYFVTVTYVRESGSGQENPGSD